MMFQASTAFTLALIAIGLGYWVLIKVQDQETASLRVFGSFLGYFIIVLAFLTLLCSGYYSLRYWEDGYFSQPNAGQMARMHKGGMMGQMQGCNPDMMGKMGMQSGQRHMMMDQEKYCLKGGQKMKGGMMHDEQECMKDKKGEMMKKMDDSKSHPDDNDK